MVVPIFWTRGQREMDSGHLSCLDGVLHRMGLAGDGP